MKTLLISLKLLKKDIMINLLLISSLATIITLFIILLNTSDISAYSVNILRNSEHRIMYAMNSYMDSSIYKNRKKSISEAVEPVRKAFRDELIKKCSSIKGFRGISTIGQAEFSDLEQVPTEIESTVWLNLVDDLTASSVKYPLSEGRWISDANIEDGCYPCVIGGVYAKNYSVGDRIKVYASTRSDSNSLGSKECEFVICGKFTEAFQLLDLNVIYPSLNLAASSLYENNTNKGLVVYTYLSGAKGVSTFLNKSCLVYFDSSLNESDLIEASKILNSPYTITDTQLIAAEERNEQKINESLLPFYGLLLLVWIRYELTLPKTQPMICGKYTKKYGILF